LPSGRFQARYRDRNGNRHTAPMLFATKTAAREWLEDVSHNIRHGGHVDPKRGEWSFRELAEDWLAGADVAPKTRDGYRSLLDHHLIPFFGDYRIADVTAGLVRRFMAQLKADGAKPGTVRNAVYTTSAVMAHGVDEGRLVRNVVSEVTNARKRTKRLPVSQPKEVVPLTLQQVDLIARHITVRPGHGQRPSTEHPEFAVLVRFAALSGLRAGELRGLRVECVDFLRSVVQVRETVASLRGGVQADGQPPKSKQVRRVPVPRSAVEMLSEHLGERATQPKAFVFPDPVHGGPLRWTWFYNVHFLPAVVRAGLGAVRFHDLRHTFASQMLAQGETMLAVSKMLGHSTITVTERVYAHLMPDALDAAADRLDERYRAAVAAPIQDAQVRQIGSS
jgi:integrase